jgi:hypothetical protein
MSAIWILGRCKHIKFPDTRNSSQGGREGTGAETQVLHGLCSFMKYWNPEKPNNLGEEDCVEFVMVGMTPNVTSKSSGSAKSLQLPASASDSHILSSATAAPTCLLG